MKRNFTDKQAIIAIRNKALKSVSAVLRQLGANPVSGSSHVLIKKIAWRYSVNTTHWLGCRHMLGKVAPNRKSVVELMVLNGPNINSHDLKLRLIRDGVKAHQCEKCKRTEWNGKPIPLDLHHENGNRRDNRSFNVKLFCPNCHAQTPNYCGKAIPLKRAVAQEQRRQFQELHSAGATPVGATNIL